jgi:hypothetical protein
VLGLIKWPYTYMKNSLNEKSIQMIRRKIINNNNNSGSNTNDNNNDNNNNSIVVITINQKTEKT